MKIFSYSSKGFDGDLVEIEINNFTRSLPGIEIVGLPGSAVRESKVRVRSAILNSGFLFPKGRVILNMAPAGEKKEGALYDLPFACSIISLSSKCQDSSFMILGELTLSGEVREINGILPAIYKGINCGITKFIVPYNNRIEATLLGKGEVYPVKNLQEAIKIVTRGGVIFTPSDNLEPAATDHLDFSDISGLDNVKRATEIAVAGGHNLFLFGPPGVGKSMVLNRIKGILPKLSRKQAIETSMVWSLAAKVSYRGVLIDLPPIRKPHHGASLEGMIGGGSLISPGEISLAHNGFLLLDELPEFKSTIIQSLREPLEDHRVSINRASISTWYPADFQIIATSNPCPCGNLGKKDSICFCTDKEIRRYWKKIGGAIMDRIDIRIPVEADLDTRLKCSSRYSSSSMIKRIESAIKIQNDRYRNKSYSRNSRVNPSDINQFCKLDPETRNFYVNSVEKMSISSRGCHSVLKISRTISDLDGRCNIIIEDIAEALTYRRYGDEDYYFK